MKFTDFKKDIIDWISGFVEGLTAGGTNKDNINVIIKDENNNEYDTSRIYTEYTKNNKFNLIIYLKEHGSSTNESSQAQ